MALTKNFPKIIGGLITLLLVPIGSWAACTGSSPSWSSTPDYSSVSSCVSQASAGDTITVSAGSATWTSLLTITKGINLIGAGIGNTVISNGRSSGYLIGYKASSNSENFRVSGFTFDLNNKTGIILQPYEEPTVSLVRIDNNRFTDSTQGRSCVMNYGAFGVIDNNTFDAVTYPLGLGNAKSGADAWASYSDDFHGTNLNMYAEDNTFEFSKYCIISDCDQGGRYVLRYNTITQGSTPDYGCTMCDTHEWGTSGYACMGVEVYGNKVIGDSGYRLAAFQGAGRNIVHHNIMNNAKIHIYSDGGGGCPTGSPANYVDRQPMNNYYLWSNRLSETGRLMEDYVSGNVCGTVVENETFFMHNESFDGTEGVGCGTLASRPATCTTGVGYWATDQSCRDLTGMVGASPSTPISGTLYKCTSTDTWEAYYTPYTYPHPLRGDTVLSPPSPPSPPSNLRINP